MLGDIIAVYASDGTKLIEYHYDAWGRFWTSYRNGGQNTSATKNSFGYRGYYYDKDLEMYYLASRYYDAKIMRFISPDSLVSTGVGLIGYNMYAYCNNNPIVYTDDMGLSPEWFALVWNLPAKTINASVYALSVYLLWGEGLGVDIEGVELENNASTYIAMDEGKAVTGHKTSTSVKVLFGYEHVVDHRVEENLNLVGEHNCSAEKGYASYHGCSAVEEYDVWSIPLMYVTTQTGEIVDCGMTGSLGAFAILGASVELSFSFTKFLDYLFS